MTAFLFDFWSDSSMIVHCTDEDLQRMKSNRMSVMLSNHPTDFDFIHMIILYANGFTQTDAHRGTMKDDLKFLPGFGWMLNMAEHLFLKKAFDKDEHILKDKLSKYLSYENGFALGFLPEGRIFSQKRLKETIAVAEKSNQESFRNILIPKWKGFASIIGHLKKSPKQSEILIINMTIAYENNITPTYGGILNGQANVAHIHIKLVPLDQVEASKESLYSLFREKDTALDEFKKFGTFKGENLKSFKLEKNMKVLKSFVFWFNVCITLAIVAVAFGYWKALLAFYVLLFGSCKFFELLNLLTNTISSIIFSVEYIFAKVFRTKPGAAGNEPEKQQTI